MQDKIIEELLLAASYDEGVTLVGDTLYMHITETLFLRTDADALMSGDLSPLYVGDDELDEMIEIMVGEEFKKRLLNKLNL